METFFAAEVYPLAMSCQLLHFRFEYLPGRFPNFAEACEPVSGPFGGSTTSRYELADVDRVPKE
jgi:hypothetical protein